MSEEEGSIEEGHDDNHEYRVSGFSSLLSILHSPCSQCTLATLEMERDYLQSRIEVLDKGMVVCSCCLGLQVVTVLLGSIELESFNQLPVYKSVEDNTRSSMTAEELAVLLEEIEVRGQANNKSV
jgi:hypothetical protein